MEQCTNGDADGAFLVLHKSDVTPKTSTESFFSTAASEYGTVALHTQLLEPVSHGDEQALIPLAVVVTAKQQSKAEDGAAAVELEAAKKLKQAEDAIDAAADEAAKKQNKLEVSPPPMYQLSDPMIDCPLIPFFPKGASFWKRVLYNNGKFENIVMNAGDRAKKWFLLMAVQIPGRHSGAKSEIELLFLDAANKNFNNAIIGGKGSYLLDCYGLKLLLLQVI